MNISTYIRTNLVNSQLTVSANQTKVGILKWSERHVSNKINSIKAIMSGDSNLANSIFNWAY